MSLSSDNLGTLTLDILSRFTDYRLRLRRAEILVDKARKLDGHLSPEEWFILKEAVTVYPLGERGRRGSTSTIPPSLMRKRGRPLQPVPEQHHVPDENRNSARDRQAFRA